MDHCFLPLIKLTGGSSVRKHTLENHQEKKLVTGRLLIPEKQGAWKVIFFYKFTFLKKKEKGKKNYIPGSRETREKIELTSSLRTI